MFAGPIANPRLRAFAARSVVPVVAVGAVLLACNRDAPTAPNGSPRPGGPSQSLLGTPTLEAPDWIGLPLTLNMNVVAMTDASSTQEELPGMGHKFELLGVMERDTDPENAIGNPGGSGGGVGGNEVISATTTPATIALAFRNLPPGIKITAFTNQLGLKYFFVDRSCGGGSPRIVLLVDADGDGDFDQDPPTDPPDDPDDSPDFAANGHVNPPALAACPPDRWQYENLTDELARWEVTPGGSVPGIVAFVTPWDPFAAAVTAAFPSHRVIAGFLVDDSCSFFAASCGKAYYDLVTIENRTLETWHDTVKR